MSKGRSFSRLNVGAFASLRQRLLHETHVGRREFLIGAAASITAVAPLAKAAASAASLGGYSIRTRKGKGKELDRVTISLYKGCEWTLDRTLYEGKPKLEVNESEQGATIRLTGARYPGSRFALNLEATVKRGVVGNTIEFKFTDTGAQGVEFAMKAPLADWLQGKKQARTQISADQAAGLLSHPGFFEHASMVASTAGVVRYEANGNLVFKGDSALHAEGHDRVAQRRGGHVHPYRATDHPRRSRGRGERGEERQRRAPADIAEPQRAARDVRGDLRHAMQRHRLGQRQQPQQHAHQDHAAGHPEDARQERRGDDRRPVRIGGAARNRVGDVDRGVVRVQSGGRRSGHHRTRGGVGCAVG